jgi:hypothetical protein
MKNKKPTIICISAKARHGKDELAKLAIEYLQHNHPQYKTKKLAFGNFVKDVCHTYFDCTYERNSHNRTQWQRVGTDVGRNNHPDIWVNMTVDLVKGIFTDCDFIFISDCRFPNELDRWRQEGFNVVTVRVNRPNFNNRLTEEQKNHLSETSLDDYGFDYYIENDDTLEIYAREIGHFVETKLL